jgi:hypothetical protein
MNESDHVSIAHSKIDKFESLLLINNVLKVRLIQHQMAFFFKLKLPNINPKSLKNLRYKQNRRQTENSVFRIKKILSKLVNKTLLIKKDYLSMLRIFYIQSIKLNQIKLQKVI